MNNKKQKLLIEKLLGSAETFSKVNGILKSEYFDPEYRKTVSFIQDYFGRYNALPEKDVVDAEFDQLFNVKPEEKSNHQYVLDSIEKFCRESAVRAAVTNALDDIQNGDISDLLTELNKCLSITLDVDMGIDLMQASLDMLNSCEDNSEFYPTGITQLDDLHKFRRKTQTLLSANSGGGKSIMMANIALALCRSGLDVLFISLELPEEMIFLRGISMVTGVGVEEWSDHKQEIVEDIGKKQNNYGSFIIKRLPNGANANKIHSFLKHYQSKFGKSPDVLVVDYLDIMTPNKSSKDPQHIKDEQKSGELYELLHLYDMIGLTASQQNRQGLDAGSNQSQAIMAGALAKVNAVDAWLSIFMTPEMRLSGEINLCGLKFRSGKGVGQIITLSFNQDTLQIGNLPKDMVPSRVIPSRKKKKMEESRSKKIDSDKPTEAEEHYQNQIDILDQNDCLPDENAETPYDPPARQVQLEFDEINKLIEGY